MPSVEGIATSHRAPRSLDAEGSEPARGLRLWPRGERGRLVSQVWSVALPGRWSANSSWPRRRPPSTWRRRRTTPSPRRPRVRPPTTARPRP
eukprot:3900716-Prymnesium_polylepis.1